MCFYSADYKFTVERTSLNKNNKFLNHHYSVSIHLATLYHSCILHTNIYIYIYIYIYMVRHVWLSICSHIIAKQYFRDRTTIIMVNVQPSYTETVT
jgi:hypothetical protein